MLKPVESTLTPNNTFRIKEESLLRSHRSVADERCGLAQVGTAMKARKKLDRKLKADKNKTDKYFSNYLCLRSEPVNTFLQRASPKSVLPISSMNEDYLLRELGVTVGERNLIEGLLSSRSGSYTRIGLTEEQQTGKAICRLAANPTPEIKAMQRRTAGWLLRPFPLGYNDCFAEHTTHCSFAHLICVLMPMLHLFRLRFSGKNMSPLPCWLAGAQHVCTPSRIEPKTVQ